MRTDGLATSEPEAIEPQAIQLVPLRINTMEVEIEGITPLIVHRWSEKAKKQMLDQQTGKTRMKKAPKDPNADYQSARYVLPDGRDAFPAVAFKAAMIGAARHFEGVTMTSLKAALFVEGIGPEQLVPIDGKPEMREDTVRIGMGTADLRYRPIYFPWSAKLTVRFVQSSITAESVIALVDAGGLGGVGEWRPSAPKSYTGSYGQFRVKGER